MSRQLRAIAVSCNRKLFRTEARTFAGEAARCTHVYLHPTVGFAKCQVSRFSYWGTAGAGKNTLACCLAPGFIQVHPPFPLQDRNLRIRGLTREHQGTRAQRAASSGPLTFTGVLTLMTIKSLTPALTDRTLPGTPQIRVISQPHRVHAANTMKCRFQLCQTLTIGAAYMLAGVFQGVP